MNQKSSSENNDEKDILMPQDHREKRVSDSPSPYQSSNSTEAGPRNDNYYDDDEEN